jgi:prepilin-type N-terminal cleavage/methylation domain-containing protein
MTGSARVSKREPRSAHRVDRGFSLIELIAVLVITAVLSLAAGPVLSSVDNNRQALAASTLRRDLAYARQVAIATGTRSWVVFDAVGQTYELYQEDPDNPGRASRVLLRDPARGKDFQVAMGSGAQLASVTIESDGDEIGFTYLGQPLLEDESDMTQNAQITLTGSRTIVVTGVTGHVYQQ